MEETCESVFRLVVFAKGKRMPNNNTVLRWAGGKSWFLKQFGDLISTISINNYYEPFLGGASAFLSLEKTDYKHAYLSDTNPDLINFYIAVRDNPLELYELFLSMNNTEDDYYRIRSIEFDSDIERAAQFLFLNQTSFNGIYRVNRNGKYNVPYGFRKNVQYDFSKLEYASKKLQNARLKCGDFAYYKYRIKADDLVFLDPPYTVSHNNNGFIEYNKKLFSIEDQFRLKDYIDFIRKKGAYYILTNAAHPTIKEIFSIDGDQALMLERNSLIGGKAAKRGKITEYLFTNIPEGEI